ncbi:MAG TPA: ABC transporter ATP-binding protein [Bacillota bacterium]|nr:ABC transporter ATP-binding protein [Bacillota bacterium]
MSKLSSNKVDIIMTDMPLDNPTSAMSQPDTHTSTPGISIQNVTKLYGHNVAVNHFSLTVNHGEIMGLLGPNGSGKTTLIKLILGFLYAKEGQITINGYDSDKDYEASLEKVGAIVENPDMYRELSGLNNLRLYASLHDGIDEKRIEEVLRLVGMTDVAKKKVGTYSLGMKQRIGIAMAMLNNPSVLILDEPTNGLDPQGIYALRSILKDLAHNHGVAVLISSHLISEMEQICDRCAVIAKGELLSVSPIAELLSSSSKENMDAPVKRITVSDVAKAKASIDAEYGALIVEVTSDYIDIRLTAEQTAKITKLLVLNDVDVFNIETVHRSLESSYLEIVGGEKHE